MKKLAAEKLREDPRVAEAEKLMAAALADAQGDITEIRPSDPERTAQFEAEAVRVKKVRGSALWYPYISSGVGHGSLVELADGSVKLDYVNGIGVYPGHSLPELLEASIEAALDDTVMQGNLQQTAPSIDLMERLGRLARFDHCYLTTSGAMACENALKICFQKNFPRRRLLALGHNFIGRTIGLLNVTDKAAYRVGIPSTISVDYVPLDEERALDVLKEHLARYPDEYAAMTIELVQGEGGFYTASKELFHEMIDLLHAHGVLVIVDEVQTFGRTLELFAHHHFGLQGKVDVLTVGKLSQACATLFNAEIAPKPGLVAQTFTASTSAIYAAHKILDRLEEPGRYGPEGLHARLHKRLVDHLTGLPDVHGPYGLGLMVAFTAFDGSPEKTKELLLRLFDNGLIAFIAGAKPTRIRLIAPLLTTSETEIDLVAEILAKSLQEVR